MNDAVSGLRYQVSQTTFYILQAAAQQTSLSMLGTISDAESDRRLRPVLDALFSCNTKHALKLVQQALQKRPGWPAARALRACIYLHQQRWDQAHQEISEVRNQIDTGVVSVTEDAAKKLYMYYQEVRREDLAAQVYEMVWKQSNSQDLRIAETAFSLYIRGNAFSSAQKLATKLHRIASSRTQRYVFWATAALWLGVTYHTRSLPPALPPSSASNLSSSTKNRVNSSTLINHQTDARMLKLGCAMMTKALAASSVAPSAEMVRFATRVFKEAGEFDSAIQLISHPQLVMDETEMLHLRADISFSSTKDVSDYCTLLTQHSPNDWGYWLRYFESLKEQHPDKWLEEAQEMIDKALTRSSDRGEASKKTEPPRGAHLAQMELLHCREDLHGMSESIIKYFDLFGDKSVVSRDLRPWISLLQQNDKLFTSLFHQLESVCQKRGFPHHLHLCWLKLWFDCLEETSDELIARYIDHRLPGLESTDRQPGDDYIILAAHKVLPTVSAVKKLTTSIEGQGEDYDSERYNDASAVLKCIMLVEAALIWSPCNYDFKLLLLRLYEALGGVDKMAMVWDSLDVKHVQLSTLTHIVLKPYFECGHHQPLQTLIESIDSLWREINLEIPDCTTRALQDGSLNAAVDFMLFKLRLERSIILAETMVAEAHLEVLITGGEPLGVRRALNTLRVQPKFTSDSLDGSKRMLSNEDVMCYRFWNFRNYDKDSRFDSLHEDILEEGAVCEPERLSTLQVNLVSLTALLQLTERNGNDGNLLSNPSVQHQSSQTRQIATMPPNLQHTQEIASLVSDDILRICDNGKVSDEAALRARVARNLVDVWSLLNQTVSGRGGLSSREKDKEGMVNGNGHGDEHMSESIKTLVHDARELVRQVGQMCKEAVGDEEVDEKSKGYTSSYNKAIKFPRQLRECCKVAFNLLLLVGIAVSSFSPILTKGMRKTKKEKLKSGADGAQKHQKTGTTSGFSVQSFEAARNIVLMYRDELMAATVRIQEWVTACIDDGVNWAEHVFEHGLYEQVAELIPDKLCEAPLLVGNGAAHEDNDVRTKKGSDEEKIDRNIDRNELCKDVVDSIRSSQSVSCSALLESLTSVTRRLQLADL